MKINTLKQALILEDLRYSITVHVQPEDKFDVREMFTPDKEKNGVYFRTIMNSARKLISGLGSVSEPDPRTRLRVSFYGVAEKKKANPEKIFEELIQAKKPARDRSVSLQLLHSVLRLYGDVDNSNGLSGIIPKEIYKPFVCPHLTKTGWVMLRCINLGPRRDPTWILDVDPIHNFTYEYISGSVVMVVEP